jgi:hypothetical protein
MTRSTDVTATTAPWQLGPRYMLRVGGLPVESMAQLRSPKTVAWADAVIAAQDSLAERGIRIGDVLHEHVKANTDEHQRRLLINVRRNVFNNQLPRDLSRAHDLANMLAVPVGAELDAWLQDRADLDDLVASGTDIMVAEILVSRTALRALAGEPRLRQGLLLASASLDTYLDGYRNGTGSALTKRERRIERTLVEYLYRIAYKTSPFSTFTGLALGEFDSTADGLFRAEISDRWSSNPRLNVATLARLADLIVENDELRADLPVALTPGWQSELDRIRYVRRSVRYGDDSATVGFDLVHTDVYFLNQTTSLSRTLELLERQPVLRFRDLVARLGVEVGSSSDESERWVSTLRHLGLLEVPSLRLDVHDADPLRGFAECLQQLEQEWTTDLAGRLETIASAIKEFGHSDLPGRRRLLKWLRTELGSIQVDLGASDVTLPQTLIYEDVNIHSAPIASSAVAWTTHFQEALGLVTDALPAFDGFMPHQLTLKGFFLARYGRGGRCEDLLNFVHDFHEDIYDQYLRVTGERRTFDEDGEYAALDNWLNLPEVAALEQSRRTFVEGMRRAWDSSESGVDEICIEDGLMHSVVDKLTPIAAEYRPRGHFIQLARTPDGPLAVLNRSFGGVSFPFSRFTHCFRDVTGEGAGLAEILRKENRMNQPDGAVLAELVGGVLNNNLNLHGRLTDYQLVCPGDTSDGPGAEQIDVKDLYLVHDETRDRVVLRSRRLDKEVIPVYLGYLVPMALPAIPRTLLLLSPGSLTQVDIWGGVPSGASLSGVTTRPRVRFHNVVLSRRSWTAEPGSLPIRMPEDTDAQWLLRWRRWQNHHGVPDRVFAKFAKVGTEDNTSTRKSWSKPHHVDFGSYHSLLVVDHLARNARGEVEMQEMLPAEDHLYATSERGRHVAELTMEMTNYSGRS